MVFNQNMKISFNPSFKSRNQSIKKADDIQRTARNNFPYTSPTYCDAFYKTSKKWSSEIKDKYERVITRADKKLSAIRDLSAESAFEGVTFDERNLNAPIFQTLRGIKLLKVANCHECAALSIAALTANGIYDVKRVNLQAEFQYVNKETGEIEYKATEPIDHTTVIAKIGEGKKDEVVVDTWLGFADDVSGAKGKFKQILWDSDIREKARLHRSLFRVEKIQKDGILIDPDKDYTLHTKINFKEAEKTSQEDMRLIGYYTKCCYPELIKTPQRTDANN